MDLLWMILPVFLVCAAGQNVTEIKVELGQDLMLNCSIKNEILHWYMEIHSEIRAPLVSITDDYSEYYVLNSKSKYEVNNYRLIIKNISAEDCRLYFCGKTENGNMRFSNAFRIVSDVPDPPSTNMTTNNKQTQQDMAEYGRIWRNELIVYSSFMLNVVFIITGLVCACVYLKRRNCSYQVNDPSPCETPRMTEAPQYEEIHLSPRTPMPAAPPSECIYYKAQLPRPTFGIPGREFEISMEP